MNRNKIKKRGLQTGLILLTLLIPVFSIAAYFVTHQSLTNHTKIGGSHISIIEEFDPKPPEPGSTIYKKVQIRNEGPTDCYVRVRALVSNSDQGQYINFNWNTTEWTYDSRDGFYYYPLVLKKGAVTSELFTELTVDSKIPEEEIKAVDVIVYAEACQASPTVDVQAAWENFRRNQP